MFIALLFIVLFIIGIAATFFPYQMWEITEAWQYKDREANEPSDLRLVLWRVGGVAIIIGTLIMLGFYLQTAGPS
ncbi:hypothetical protein M3D53_01440 [Dermabacter hominis]|uniref:DUF6199 family natural product biosynthesis protein n=1 Tax=Dermabacter hominis TaxID=36740 RepID=UPI0021A75484|nr:DUF6199 family natural product biosynthesis protein [Dermabacter hominis]MCT2056284.1 hypothetical protein [Dermabacter hominis]MCT2083164.1 hypothetical protein [Dermabacter hominis]MCT2091932.1 hypothetical protein [Dermabacter hominis]MCT2190135.1 hypothetical protein [Dermabacter hominis]MCT2226343.1 hypothetical protein [Dermabacter hominis]